MSIFSAQIPNYKHMGKWKNIAVFFLLWICLSDELIQSINTV